tara:strand:+ start:315 stop:905 length:591 start_codon:yes stop_codon:yes gene_type:complete
MLNSDYNFADLIWVKPKSLSPSFCKKLIKKFDEEPDKYDGCVGFDRVDKTVKDTKDYVIPHQGSSWKEEDTTLYNALKKGLSEYQTYLYNISPAFKLGNINLIDGGYKLQRYEPNGFYNWHNDFIIDQRGSRVYVFMWYLNTLRKKDEGYTEFLDGTKLQPKCGSLVIFPATWTYVHRGYPPQVRKYLCNGWIYAR